MTTGHADILKRLTPDADLFAVGVARGLRLFARALHAWQAEVSGRAVEGLGAIEYDKFSELFCRIWNQLYADGLVSFRIPLAEHRGFHGPGRAIQIQRTADLEFGTHPDDHRQSLWAYTTEIVEKTRPALGNARSPIELDGAAWSPDCRVRTGIVEAEWESWLSTDASIERDLRLFPEARDHERFIELSGALALLSAEELRALGTHHSADATEQDIRFNVSRCRQSIDAVLNSSTSNPSRDCYRAVTTIREVERKASKNRRDYEGGRQKLLGAAHGDLLRILTNVQGEARSIWDAPIIRRRAQRVPHQKDVTIYIRRSANEFRLIPALRGRELKESDAAAARLLPSRRSLVPYARLADLGFSPWAAAVREVVEDAFGGEPFGFNDPRGWVR